MVVKGGIPWNKNKRLSPEHRDRIVAALIGRKHTEESKRKTSKAMMFENNPNWKGYDAHLSRQALHEWVRNHLPQPKLCESCNENPSYDLANVTGIYKRDFSNWQYWCRKCHVHSDSRIVILRTQGRNADKLLGGYRQPVRR